MIAKEQVMEKLKECSDPELHLDIVTLGLIYKVDIDSQNNVGIEMTFTSMMCPYGPALVDEIKGKIIEMEGVKTVDVKVVFDPPWKPSEEVLAQLGL